jgi:hypothetical protein
MISPKQGSKLAVVAAVRRFDRVQRLNSNQAPKGKRRTF